MTTEVKTLTVEDVMKKFQVRRNSVYRWIRLGLLKTGVKEKKEWRFLTTEVERFEPPVKKGYGNVIRGKHERYKTTVELLLANLDDQRAALPQSTIDLMQRVRDATV